MYNLFKKILGTKNEREVKKLRKIVEKINNLEVIFEKLTDEELKNKTNFFKERLSKGETLEDILIEAFATVRETSKRVLGMRHYDVQLIGGIVLFEGKITEMKTGEGKTLVATCPIYLAALEGKGVHVITVNDYLAQRDMELMRPLFEFLGLTSGVILNESTIDERKIAYNSDITYGTTAQFGFDYLKDNMIKKIDNKIQRGFNYCIIDEADSILIDEAKTPLIISGMSKELNPLYHQFFIIASLLDRSYETEKFQNILDISERKKQLEMLPKEFQKDYEVDEKNRNVILTEKGIRKVEKFLKIENLYSPENIELTHFLKQALSAKELYKKDKDYLVKNNEIVIIDSFTGRAMEGRRFSDGLHQALEIKEGISLRGEAETIASITIQNYFKMYNKLSGMTGTGETETLELVDTYNLKVVVIPTNKPIQRKDYTDVVYKTSKEKIEAIVKKVKELHLKGQPILIGTASIKNSEEFSNYLKKEGIQHNVLNAKHHAKEAEIIAQAGRVGAVTIATNMAGRGTDILLGGNPEALAQKLYSENQEKDYYKILEEMKEICEEEKKKVRDLGGLFILGTERHESRRIDNQLRGRAGRQGDVGETQFYLSFDDEIMTLFGGEKAKKLLDSLGIKYGEEIRNTTITNAIERAQKGIESKNFTIRKNLLEYDEIINKQRKAIYETRDNILKKESFDKEILDIIRENISRVLEDKFVAEDKNMWDIEGVVEYLRQNYFYEIKDLQEYKFRSKEEYCQLLTNDVYNTYIEKRNKKEMEILEKEREIFLNILDENWREYLSCSDGLKASIHLRSYGQKNPVIEYKILVGELYEEMIINIKEQSIFKIFEFLNGKQEEIEKNIEANLCSCGSGKIKEKCCFREAKRENLDNEELNRVVLKVG